MVYFDSETCPICGITLSDNLSVNKTALIELEFENEIVVSTAINLLEENEIKSKYSASGKEKILIPEKNFEDAKTILKS